MSNNGMTEEEARAFHGYFISGFLGFTLIAVGAHVMAYMWRPWL
jgi:light-harvesting complex 1 beta chain